MVRKIIVGLSCLLLSVCALGDDAVGGLEGMIDQMEKHGATRDLQLGMPAAHSSWDGQETGEAEGPAENPVTRVIIPGRTVTAPRMSTSGTAQTSRRNIAPVGAQSADPSVLSAPPVPPEPLRHNPLADQPVASGGLEQIFNIMELNASRPLRQSTPPAEARPGVQSEAGLSEKLAR